MARVEDKWQASAMGKIIRSGRLRSALTALCAFLLALGSGAEVRAHCASGQSPVIQSSAIQSHAGAGSAGGQARDHAQGVVGLASEDHPASQGHRASHDRSLCAPASCQALVWQQMPDIEFASAGAVELPVQRLAGVTIPPLARPPDLDA